MGQERGQRDDRQVEHDHADCQQPDEECRTGVGRLLAE
jgi:hypothetical protein